MLSKPFQQGLALLITAAIVSVVIVSIIQPLFAAAEAAFERRDRLNFEAQRIARAVDANRDRSPEDLEALKVSVESQLFAGTTQNEAQSGLQDLLSTAVQSTGGLLNSMRLGESRTLPSGLTTLTLDVTATLPEEQMVVFLDTLARAEQRLAIPKLSIQKTSTFDQQNTNVTIDLRIVGYWPMARPLDGATS